MFETWMCKKYSSILHNISFFLKTSKQWSTSFASALVLCTNISLFVYSVQLIIYGKFKLVWYLSPAGSLPLWCLACFDCARFHLLSTTGPFSNVTADYQNEFINNCQVPACWHICVTKTLKLKVSVLEQCVAYFCLDRTDSNLTYPDGCTHSFLVLDRLIAQCNQT